MGLKLFFTYFGGKWRTAPHYPKPLHRTIIEPFAGSAGYACRYPEHDVILVEKNPKIAAVWRYLIAAKPADILRLPTKVSHVDEIPGPDAARWLVGLWLNKGAAEPHMTPSRWVRDGIRPNSSWGEVIRERIASQLGSIRHWQIIEADYSHAPRVSATWFIDPPYMSFGHRYPSRLGREDYRPLGEWCRGLPGQVIVCEQAGADWLPFRTFRTIKALEGKHGRKKSAEIIWTNEGTAT